MMVLAASNAVGVTDREVLMATSPRFPRHWRLYQVMQPTDLENIHLDEGLWILGFADPPPKPRGGSAGEVGTPDGAVAALRILVTQGADQAWKSYGGAQSTLSLTEVLAHQIATKIAETLT